jgi:hypothetical protein
VSAGPLQKTPGIGPDYAKFWLFYLRIAIITPFERGQGFRRDGGA